MKKIFNLVYMDTQLATYGIVLADDLLSAIEVAKRALTYKTDLVEIIQVKELKSKAELAYAHDVMVGDFSVLQQTTKFLHSGNLGVISYILYEVPEENIYQ